MESRKLVLVNLFICRTVMKILEKAMATHSSTLPWKIPMDGGAWWAAVHGVARSRTQLSVFTFMHWRRQWQPTPVFLPGESQGQRSLVGCLLWGQTELDTTEATSQQQHCLSSGRRQWHPTPVLLPGKSHGRRGLVGCSPWGL